MKQYHFDRLALGLIIIVALLHIYGIDFPIIDRHSWRQSVTLSIAQNISRFGYNFTHPLSDICGNVSPEVFASEFPLFNSIIAFFYNNFSWNIVFARGINLTVTSIGFYYFYLLVSKILNRQAAFYALLFCMSSMILLYARKAMPDTFSVALVIVGVYYFYQYLKCYKWWTLVMGFVLTTLGILSKLPAVIILLFLIFPLLEGKLISKRKIVLAIVATISFLPAAYWYFVWLPYLEEHYTCFPLMYPTSLKEGLVNYFASFDEIFMRFLKAYFWVGPLVLYIVGVVKSIKQKNIPLILFFVINYIIFSAFIAKTGTVFQAHDYYVIPIIPMMSLFIGYALSMPIFRNKYIVLLFILYLYYPGTHAYSEMHIKERPHYLRISKILDDLNVAKRAKLLVNGRSLNPMFMYHTGRHGWNVNNDILTKYTWIPDYISDGLEYIVVDRHSYEPLLNHKIIYQDEDFVVYEPVVQN